MINIIRVGRERLKEAYEIVNKVERSRMDCRRTV